MGAATNLTDASPELSAILAGVEDADHKHTPPFDPIANHIPRLTERDDALPGSWQPPRHAPQGHLRNDKMAAEMTSLA